MGTFWLGLMAAGAAVALGSRIFRWYRSPEQKRRRWMRSVPRRPIGDVRDGELVRVMGIAEAGRPLSAPASCRDCVYWRIVVGEEEGTGKRARWNVILEEHGEIDFVVRDRSGSAFVRTSGAQVLLEIGAQDAKGFLGDAPPDLQALLRERGRPTSSTDNPLTYVEYVIGVGEAVTVIGVGRWEADPDPSTKGAVGFRERAQRLVLMAPEDGPLVVTDEIVELVVE